MLRGFIAYALALGCILSVVAVPVHFLMARQYRLNALEGAVILANTGEERLEHNRLRQPIARALALALSSPDEGLTWLDLHRRPIAAIGATATHDAAVYSLRVHERRADGWLRATISNRRIEASLRDLDLGLGIGTLIAMLVGGLIITLISARAITRIEAAFQRMRRFTGDAAHELRTPLAVIANNSDALAFDASDEEARERSLVNIRQAAYQMRKLMDGLLILARADEGVTQDLHAIDLDHCVENVVENYRAEAAARDLTLTVHSHANQVIYGYPEQVTHVIGNLIENALRYTLAGGSIDITSKVERGAALIEVRDTGIGIAPEALDHVFDRFWREGAARTVAGSGLGLAIARSLARVHGGDVWVRSRLGEGSTFTIRLPLRPQRVSGFSTIS